MDEIKNRLAEALSIRGMKQVELAEKTGLSQSSINSWLNHRWQPKQTALHLMAKALDVSEMWLAGCDVPMERPPEQKQMDDLAEFLRLMRENKKYTKIMDYVVKLDDNQLIVVEQMLKGLANDQH